MKEKTFLDAFICDEHIMPTVILRNVSDQGHLVGNDIAIWLDWLQAFIGKQTFS
jgi:hypothetical protein